MKDGSIRSVISKHRPIIVGLVETKLLTINPGRVLSLWGSNPVKFMVANAMSNNSGCIILLWNPELFQVSTRHQGSRWILVVGNLVTFLPGMCCYSSVWGT